MKHIMRRLTFALLLASALFVLALLASVRPVAGGGPILIAKTSEFG